MFLSKPNPTALSDKYQTDRNILFPTAAYDTMTLSKGPPDEAETFYTALPEAGGPTHLVGWFTGKQNMVRWLYPTVLYHQSSHGKSSDQPCVVATQFNAPVLIFKMWVGIGATSPNGYGHSAREHIPETPEAPRVRYNNGSVISCLK